MGHIQKMRMEKAKRAFKEEMFPKDKARAFYVDHAGNAIGFAMERADGNVLFYNAETGHYKPNQQNFEIRPEDGAINIPPYDYKNGKIVELLSDEPAKNIQKYTCFYAAYFCGDFHSVITEAEYKRLEETGELYRGDTMDYAPIFDGKIYPDLASSSSAQRSLFRYHYDDDRRTILSRAEAAAAGLDIGRNTKIEYLYRDADNYKVWNECVIPGVLTAEQKQQILDCRLDGEWFIPSQVGLPEEQFSEWNDEVDHPYFELYEHSFEETTRPPTVQISAEALVNAFKRCAEANWEECAINHWPGHEKEDTVAPTAKFPKLDEIIKEAERRKTGPGDPPPGGGSKAKEPQKKEPKKDPEPPKPVSVPDR